MAGAVATAGGVCCAEVVRVKGFTRPWLVAAAAAAARRAMPSAREFGSGVLPPPRDPADEDMFLHNWFGVEEAGC
jgi:hypothetical protein